MKRNVDSAIRYLIVAVCTLAVAQAEAEPESFVASLAEGKPTLNVRTRYEHAEVGDADDGDALTVRTRLGYSTAPYKGFSAYVEMEDVSVIGAKDKYNQAGLNPAGADRAVVADVEGTELNQIYASYKADKCGLTVGRQRIVLGNARYIGNVGWRQNEQTYDAALVKSAAISGLDLTYGYIDTVYRIFGQQSGTESGEAANAALFESDSHVVNATIEPAEGVSATCYAYLLDLGGGAFAEANSSDTFGARVQVSKELTDKMGVDCNLEYARQSDNSATTDDVNYDADYFLVDLSLVFAETSRKVGLAYESLGSDNGASFKTPLATAHAFNGWADQFLVTPAEGLTDAYVYAGATCPISGVKVTGIYHIFESDAGSIDYGSEFDLVLSKKFGKFNVVAKFADYSADSDAGNPRGDDATKYSVQVDFAI